MAELKIVEFEFGFASNDILRVDDVQDGRDKVSRTEYALLIERKPDQQTIERTEVKLGNVNWQRTTQRVIEQG